MGADDEQHPSLSRRDSSQGTDLQLSEHDFNGRGSGIDYYHQDKEKNELLRTYLRSHIDEIATFYESHSDREERGDFIKSFFTSEPYEITLSNGVKAGIEAYSDAIHFFRGDRNNPESEVWGRWHGVERDIFGMMLLEEWTDPQALLLPSADKQIEFIGDKVKDAVLPLPQAAIDYILGVGSGFSEGKMRIYRHFSESLSKEENIKFLI